MKGHRMVTLCAALALVPAAHAELFKCIGANGRPAFTDRPCEEVGLRPEHKKETKAAPAPEPVKDMKGPPAEEQARLKELDAITVDPRANNEQKTAAQLEAGNIRRNLESHLTPADKEKRATLTKALASPDKQKRADALRELRTIYRE